MSANEVRRNPDQKQPGRQIRDIPGCIKYIILLFLILLLLVEIYAGEFRGFPDVSRFVLLILFFKLLLIILLIILIWVQRSLNAEITSPAEGVCTAEEVDPVGGFLYIKVMGTASGTVFGHYTLELNGTAGWWSVTYPPGGGTVPVSSGELGKINTTLLTDGNYTITLRVFPSGAGAPVVRTRNFRLLKAAVYISTMATVSPDPTCFDQAAELKSGSVRCLGGSMHMTGSAYVYECEDRIIDRYELRWARLAAPGPELAQPALDAADPVGSWPAANIVNSVVYSDDPTKYNPGTRVGIMPNDLINYWGSIHLGAPPPGGSDYKTLNPTTWNSRGATETPAGKHGGRFSILLYVLDTAGHRYYDLQRVWLDNWTVLCKIVKFQIPDGMGGWTDIPACTDILMSWQKLRIIGLAWDALADNAFPVAAPNDNFNVYSLSYLKEFVVTGAVNIPIVATADHPLLADNVRVPNTLAIIPADADAELLVEWDLATLDAGPLPVGGACDTTPLPAGMENKLYRRCACTYTLSLSVSDNTVTESDWWLHNPTTSQPIKIVNDLS